MTEPTGKSEFCFSSPLMFLSASPRKNTEGLRKKGKKEQQQQQQQQLAVSLGVSY